MTHSFKFRLLVASFMASLLLGGCGGGAGDPPPPPVGSSGGSQGPDTTPPTVTIANNVSASVAAGPVTFTFVFSENTGGSFDASDVTVTGGTPSAFTQVNTTQYTVVVTPAPNTAGTITVNVAAGTFTDVAGNANTAPASGVKNFAAAQTITFPSPGNQTIGTAPPALSATSTSGLPVTIASTTGSVCTVSGPTLTLVTGGTCSLTATQAGNTTYAAATPVTISFSVTGGVAPADLVFTTGLASTTRTIEGGEVGGFSGSNVDGFNCSPPAACGGGGEFPLAVTAANSYFFYFYQTPTPATDLYMGIYTLAPGVVGPLSEAVDHPGVQINGQTSIKFKVGENPEWFGTANNKFAIVLQLGKRYVAGGGACRIQLRTIVAPTASAATEYTVAFSAFSVVQDCGTSQTVAQALAASPITQVTFQAGAGGPALSAGGQTTGANLTVQANGVYPTTLVVVGGISFVGASAPPPPSTTLNFTTGLASTTRTIEGGEVGGFSGSNVDGFNCSPPAACGGGGEFPLAVTAANSYFFYFYQTPTPATDLYMGIYTLAPGVVGPLSEAVDHPGVQINGQTSIKFKVGENPEWFGTANNKFAIVLQLGKRYVAGGGACRIQLRTIVAPTASAATEYTVAFSAFSVVQDCGTSQTVAQALAASPITQVTFQAGAGGPALSAGGQTTGANLTVQANGVYPTTLVVVGGISFQP